MNGRQKPDRTAADDEHLQVRRLVCGADETGQPRAREQDAVEGGQKQQPPGKNFVHIGKPGEFTTARVKSKIFVH